MMAPLKPITFDLEAVRTFVRAVELGSFVQTAGQLQQSASAVNAQLKRLERQCGLPLIQASGAQLTLTAGGEVMIAYGRRLLALNDEAVSTLHCAYPERVVKAE